MPNMARIRKQDFLEQYLDTMNQRVFKTLDLNTQSL
jgi:hypothetical protein